MKDAFDREVQTNSRRAKIIAGIERVSTLFRATLQDQAKALNLSPLQIQIILFVAYHAKAQSTPSVIAQEFSVTKPTISDAIRVLVDKKLLLKKQDAADARGYTLQLSVKGKKLLKPMSGLTISFLDAMQSMNDDEVDTVWRGMLTLIQHLQGEGGLPVRVCFSCQHFAKDHPNGTPHYCNLMEQPLMLRDIRVDCPEHRQVI